MLEVSSTTAVRRRTANAPRHHRPERLGRPALRIGERGPQIAVAASCSARQYRGASQARNSAAALHGAGGSSDESATTCRMTASTVETARQAETVCARRPAAPRRVPSPRCRSGLPNSSIRIGALRRWHRASTGCSPRTRRHRATPARRCSTAIGRPRSIRPSTRRAPKICAARDSTWPTFDAAVEVRRQPLQGRLASGREDRDAGAVQPVGDQVSFGRREAVGREAVGASRDERHRLRACRIRAHRGRPAPPWRRPTAARRDPRRPQAGRRRLRSPGCHSPTAGSPAMMARLRTSVGCRRSSNQATPSRHGRSCGSPHHTAPISHAGCTAAIAAASGLGAMGPVRHDEHRGDPPGHGCCSGDR